MDNQLQRWILNVVQKVLGVKTTTPSWSILRGCGIGPFQINWFHASLHFNNLLNSLKLKVELAY
eukprot:1144480-Pelagomonas_calceolata.AAC.1